MNLKIRLESDFLLAGSVKCINWRQFAISMSLRAQIMQKEDKKNIFSFSNDKSVPTQYKAINQWLTRVIKHSEKSLHAYLSVTNKVTPKGQERGNYTVAGTFGFHLAERWSSDLFCQHERDEYSFFGIPSLKRALENICRLWHFKQRGMNNNY